MLYLIIINELILYPNLAETISVTNMKPIIPLESPVLLFQTPSTSLLTPLINSYFSEEDTIKSHDNNLQAQYELLE